MTQVIRLDASVAPYTPFEVTVKARNAFGDATVAPEKVIGYSGEDGKSNHVYKIMSLSILLYFDCEVRDLTFTLL